MEHDEIFSIFFGIWVVLGIISIAIFFIGKNVQLKRKLFAPFVIGVGVLFIAFIYATSSGGRILYIMVPAVALITFINLRSTNFCDSCGRTIISQDLFSKPEFCSKCGDKLR
jgi:hypothetical protein